MNRDEEDSQLPLVQFSPILLLLKRKRKKHREPISGINWALMNDIADKTWLA